MLSASLSWRGYRRFQLIKIFFMSVRLAFFFLIVLPALFSACRDNQVEDITPDPGYDYFPLEVGRMWEYEVDSIIYDPSATGTNVDSFRTYVREQITDTLLDGAGNVLYRAERYSRRSDTLPWRAEKVFTLSREGRRAFRTEDNLRFIKLVFPAGVGKSWDGNAFFDPGLEVLVAGESIQMFNFWDYRILEREAAATVGGLRFEDVLLVQNANNDGNIIERRYAVERYARGVGLIFREMDILRTDCQVCCNGDLGGACQSLPWEEKAEKGFSLRQRLVRYQ